MGLFAGMAAGYGEAQGQHNQKMLDFINQKSQTMAQLYAHLADNSTDPSLQEEFINRSKGWASANPMLDPKGYQQLVKGEKSGLHDIVDKNTQRQVSDYHTEKFGVPTTGGSQPNQPVQPQSAAIQSTTPGSGQPTPQSQSGASAAPQMGTGPNAGNMWHGAAPVAESPESQNTAPPQDMASATQPSPQGGPPIAQPQQQPAMAPPTGPNQGPPQQGGQSMQDYVKSIVGPEPPVYGPLGRETMEHQMWREAYQKRLESTIPTPTAMQGAMGSPYMPQGFASPYLGYMGREVQANSRLAGSGYKMINGQAVPLSPEEYSMAANIKMQKDQMASQLSASTIPLRQAMTQLAATKNAIIPQEMKLKLAELGMQVQRLHISETMMNAHLFSMGPDDKPLPGSLMLDGVPVSPMLSSNVKPTGQSQNRAETAIPVMEQVSSLQKFAQTNPDLFGIVQGNFEDWLAKGKNMTNDPREGELRASIISLASLMVPLHGFRSQKAAEEFMGRLSQGMSPEGFVSALTAFNAVGENIYQNGMPTIMGGQGQERPRIYKPGAAPASGNTPAPAATPVNPPKFSVGQTFSKNGKNYKIMSVDAQGNVNASEVK